MRAAVAVRGIDRPHLVKDAGFFGLSLLRCGERPHPAQVVGDTLTLSGAVVLHFTGVGRTVRRWAFRGEGPLHIWVGGCGGVAAQNGDEASEEVLCLSSQCCCST